MNKLFIVMGKSASGKSTIENKINKFGVAKKVISCTTREKRSYEKDTEDYYFLSNIVFNTYLKQNQFAEHSEYVTADGMAKYGINRNDIKLDENSYICVVNPQGMKQLVKNLGKSNCVTIYIERDDKERLLASLNRDKNVNIEEVIRRFEADKKDFEGIDEISDYVINNNDLTDAVLNIIDIIKHETNSMKRGWGIHKI